MFWGLVLEPEKTYTQIVEVPFHVSMAALDLKKSNPQEEATTLILRQHDEKFILGNLSQKHKIFNLPLALDFDLGEEIEFTVQGSSQIHLTGFLADTDELNCDEEDENEEEVDENEIGEKEKEIKKAQAAKRKLEADKNQGGSKKQRILDESFNEDTDEDDFDITENDFDSDDVEEEEEDDSDEDDEDEDDDDEEEEEEVELPKKQQQPAQSPESNRHKKQRQKLEKQQKQAEQLASKKNLQKQSKGGQQQQQQNKQGQQEQKNQKSPQKTPQPNKTPQKTPQPNKNQQKTPQQGNKTPQQGKQGKAPQQLNGSPERKPQKKVVKGVVIEDVAEGTGKVASANKKIGVQYVGRLAKSKKEFDKSHEPFRFVLGRGEVIPGWDIGVDGMRVGGKRRLTIPANLAYGSKGAPPSIPPNSSLEFEVTLVSVK